MQAARASASKIIEITDMHVNLSARSVRVGATEVALTNKEFDLLAALARVAGTAVSRRHIMEEVWGRSDVAVSKALGVHMTSLRSKIGRPGLLQTVHGYGYKLG
jgi:DNA-binding response OmpR family regulator